MQWGVVHIHSEGVQTQGHNSRDKSSERGAAQSRTAQLEFSKRKCKKNSTYCVVVEAITAVERTAAVEAAATMAGVSKRG